MYVRMWGYSWLDGRVKKRNDRVVVSKYSRDDVGREGRDQEKEEEEEEEESF